MVEDIIITKKLTAATLLERIAPLKEKDTTRWESVEKESEATATQDENKTQTDSTDTQDQDNTHNNPTPPPQYPDLQKVLFGIVFIGGVIAVTSFLFAKSKKVHKRKVKK